jgi:hypothetical protein
MWPGIITRLKPTGDLIWWKVQVEQGSRKVCADLGVELLELTEALANATDTKCCLGVDKIDRVWAAVWPTRLCPSTDQPQRQSWTRAYNSTCIFCCYGS